MWDSCIYTSVNINVKGVWLYARPNDLLAENALDR